LERLERLERFELSTGALRLIRSARTAHLATSDNSGQPHVIPICFVFDGKQFYSPIDEKPKSVSPTKLKRLINIRVNPQVALVIDHYDEDWRKLGYVLIFGHARASRAPLAPQVSPIPRHGHRPAPTDRHRADSKQELEI